MNSVPEPGTAWHWTPSAFTLAKEETPVRGLTAEVDGRVVYVNRQHRFFRVEGSFPGGVIRECFKF